MRAFLAVPFALLGGAICYVALHALTSTALAAPPSDRVVFWLGHGAPVISMLIVGGVSGFLAREHWVFPSAISGVIGAALLLWYFSAKGHWLFFAAALGVGVLIVLLGGFVGSRKAINAARTP